MAEVPEHLLRRAAERKAALAAQKAGASAEGGGPGEGGGAGAGGQAGPGAGGEAAGGGGGATTTAAPATAQVAAATATAAPPPAGPAGHTQRLLTVVKAGSIQDVKATPQDKVHVWPHLLAVEFVASLACLAFLFVFSVF